MEKKKINPYPRLPETLDRRKKYSSELKEEIFERYKKGENRYRLSKEYGIPYITIQCICDPDFEKKRNQQKKEWNHEKWETDKKYREYCKEVTKESHKYIRKINKEPNREYETKLARKRREKLKKEFGTCYEESHRKYFQKKNS